MELVKPIVRVGNSAGIVLPKGWLGGKVRVELVRKPLNIRVIKGEILEILDNYLDEILGVYLVGSYARGEEREDSDVDVLVATSGINKKIERGKYEIIMITLDKIRENIRKVLPIIPMLREAKVLINRRLLEELDIDKINKKDLKWHIETTRFALDFVEKSLEIDKEMGMKKFGSGLIYSLILRLRQVYIVDCLLKNKEYKNRDFLQILKRNEIFELYEIYQEEKVKKTRKKVDIEMAEKACMLLKKNFESQIRRLK